MKSKISVSLDADLIEAAQAQNKQTQAPVSAVINRWARAGKEQEEKAKPKSK